MLFMVIESFRDILMYGRWPDFGPLLAVGVGSLLLLGVGVALLRRFDRVYPKRLP